MGILAPRSRGIVLLSVMFLAVLIGMYIVSSAILSKGQYGSLRQSADDRRAEEAARSGLEYAQARLEENPRWRGDGNGVVVETPSLMVKEENGNVIGVVSTSDGGRAQFRIRFSLQDGRGGAHGMPDPSKAMWIDSRHVSVNNILNFNQKSLPLGDGENFSYQGNVTSYPVPAFTAAIVSEGRVFPQLGEVTAQDLNPKASRVEAVRVVEAFYRVSDFSGDAPVKDAVGMAGRDVTMELIPHPEAQQRASLTNFHGDGPTHFRSRRNVSIEDSEGNPALLESDDADLLMPAHRKLKALLSDNVRRGAEDEQGDFYKVTWDDASKVSADASSLDAGVYVYWASDEKLHYYPMDFKDYVKHIRKNPNDGGRVVNLDQGGVTFVKANSLGPDEVRSDKHRFVLTEDVQVQAVDGVKDLTIMPRGGAKEDLETPTSGNGTIGDDELPTLAETEFLIKDFINTSSNLGSQAGSPLHELLSSLGPTGNLHPSNNALVNFSGGLSWNPDGVVNNLAAAAGPNVIAELLLGALRVQVESGDPRYLTPVGGQDYTVKPEAIGILLGGGGSGGSMEEIDLGSAAASEPLGARDFEITMAPQGESGARLLVPGDVRIAADVKGSGASITAKGEIRLVGVGIDLDAGRGESSTGVSLYSAKNITLSTLRKKQQGKEYEFAGVDIQGVLYSWGDITVKTSSTKDVSSDLKRFFLQGSMVAYGGEPGRQRAGHRGGNITIRSHQVDLVFDPAYLLGLSGDTEYKVTLSPLSQSYRH